MSATNSSLLIQWFDFKVSHFLVVIALAGGVMFYLDYALPFSNGVYIAQLSALLILAVWLALKDSKVLKRRKTKLLQMF